MKKSNIAIASLNAVSVAGMIAALGASPVQADVTCTSGSNTTAVACVLATGGYIAQAANFTGSVNVGIGVAEDTTGFGACALHFQGTGNRYGLTTMGGSLETVTGTLQTTAPSGNILSGGC